MAGIRPSKPGPTSGRRSFTQPRYHNQRRSSRVSKDGEREVKFLENFYDAVIAIAAVGSSITFTVIPSDIADPTKIRGEKNLRFNKEQVRELVVVSWLLFVLALGCASFLACFLRWNRGTLERGLKGRESNWWRLYGFCTTALLQLLGVGAFLCLALVIWAYMEQAGIAAIALITVYGVTVVTSLGLHACGKKPVSKGITRSA
jgi:hypothetical protein